MSSSCVAKLSALTAVMARAVAPVRSRNRRVMW
jgi:hypothetical protein